MAASSISICANALVLLGGEPISSFTDDTTGSRIAALLYEQTYHAMLTETLWHFATRTEMLSKSAVKPTNGYANKFQIPADCLYVVKTDARAFEIYGDEIYANRETLTIEYVYPVDEINLPSYFVKALEYNLASLFAIPLTGNATRAEYYRSLYEMEMKKARRADASQRPASQFGQNPSVLTVRL